MKKILSVIFAVLMAGALAGTLVGCGNDENTIRVLLLANNQENEFYEEYFSELEEEYGVKIDYDGYQEADYYNRLGSEIQQGKTPDIFYLRPNEIKQYKDIIANLQDYADTQTEVDLTKIYDSALDMYRYNPETGELGNKADDLYAFPKDLSVQQLGYNKTLIEKYATEIEKAGITLPWEMDFSKETYTWQEYAQMTGIISSAAQKNGEEVYGTDVPSIQVLVKSFGGEILDLNTDTVNITSDSVQQAIEYQAQLCASGAASYRSATYANFTAGKVAFYGLVGSWEVAEYDDYFGEGNWGVMPWPTTDGGTEWYGLITSAGYAVSESCAQSAKGETAMKIAASFMTDQVQDRLVREAKISLPLNKDLAQTYVDPSYDEVYSPSTRSVFIDVISGEHGFFPVEYSTYNSAWLDVLDSALELMWTAQDPESYYASANWSETQSSMQAQYNEIKDR